MSFGDGNAAGSLEQHLSARAVVGYGVKIFLLSPPNYVTRSRGQEYSTGDFQAGDPSSYELRPTGLKFGEQAGTRVSLW